MTRPPDYDIRAKDVPEALFPNGRCRFSLGPGTTRLQEARRRSMDALRREWGAWDILKAVEAGELGVQAVHAAVTEHGAGAVAELRGKLRRERGTVPTIKEAASEYLGWHKAEGHRQRTEKLAEAEVRAILRQIDPGTRLDKLTAQHAHAAVHTLKNGDRAAQNTVRIRMSRLAAIVSHAHRRELEAARIAGRVPAWRMPDLGLKYPEQVSRVRVATRAEVMALLSHAVPYQDAYLRSFLHVGLRASELIYTRAGVDLDVTTWTWKIQPREGWRPKSKNSTRTLSIPKEPAELRGAIRRYLKLNGGGTYTFRNPRTGRRWTINVLAADFYSLCDEAGVPSGQKQGGLTLHTLRHTCATNLIRAGVLESIVAGILGDTIQTVVKTYSHPGAEDFAQGIARGEAYE